jgi:hypothetical protein
MICGQPSRGAGHTFHAIDEETFAALGFTPRTIAPFNRGSLGLQVFETFLY